MSVCQNFRTSCNSFDSHNSCNSRYTINTCVIYMHIYINFSAQQLLFLVIEIYDYLCVFVLPQCHLTLYYCLIYYCLNNKFTCNNHLYLIFSTIRTIHCPTLHPCFTCNSDNCIILFLMYILFLDTLAPHNLLSPYKIIISIKSLLIKIYILWHNRTKPEFLDSNLIKKISLIIVNNCSTSRYLIKCIDTCIRALYFVRFTQHMWRSRQVANLPVSSPKSTPE